MVINNKSFQGWEQTAQYIHKIHVHVILPINVLCHYKKLYIIQYNKWYK